MVSTFSKAGHGLRSWRKPCEMEHTCRLSTGRHSISLETKVLSFASGFGLGICFFKVSIFFPSVNIFFKKRLWTRRSFMSWGVKSECRIFGIISPTLHFVININLDWGFLKAVTVFITFVTLSPMSDCLACVNHSVNFWWINELFS